MTELRTDRLLLPVTEAIHATEAAGAMVGQAFDDVGSAVV